MGLETDEQRQALSYGLFFNSAVAHKFKKSGFGLSKNLTLHLNSVYDAPIQFLDAKLPTPITSLSEVEFGR